jgi:hypothetical protein
MYLPTYVVLARKKKKEKKKGVGGRGRALEIT